jgi:20S proteasome subunit beta 7
VVEEGFRLDLVRVYHSFRCRRSADRCRREEEALSLTDSHPSFSPANIYDYLANLFYARRSKINPIWNAVLVGGWDKNKNETWVDFTS